MNLKAVLALSAFIIGSLGGNLFFKLSAAQTGPLTFSLDTFVQAATRPTVILGVVSYFFAAFALLVSMSLVPLNLAASVSALSYVGIVLMSKFFFHETIALTAWIGMAMITGGMFLIVRGLP